MRSMQQRLLDFYQMFSLLECHVYHHMRGTNYPFLVWSEQGEEPAESFHTDGHKADQVITGVVDYYTKQEFDHIVDEIQMILDDAGLVAWELDAVQYEDETGLIHYTWTWRLS